MKKNCKANVFQVSNSVFQGFSLLQVLRWTTIDLDNNALMIFS